MNVANNVLWRMAIILKANKVNLFVSSVLFVFWYHSPNFLDTTCRTSILKWTQQTSCGVGIFTSYELIHPPTCMFHVLTWQMDYKCCSVIKKIHSKKTVSNFITQNGLMTTCIDRTICTNLCWLEACTTLTLYTELSINTENNMLGCKKKLLKTSLIPSSYLLHHHLFTWRHSK
jgi:hypothetical protein